jgi:hypothetical protein
MVYAYPLRSNLFIFVKILSTPSYTQLIKTNFKF